MKYNLVSLHDTLTFEQVQKLACFGDIVLIPEMVSVTSSSVVGAGNLNIVGNQSTATITNSKFVWSVSDHYRKNPIQFYDHTNDTTYEDACARIFSMATVVHLNEATTTAANSSNLEDNDRSDESDENDNDANHEYFNIRSGQTY